VLVRGFRGFVTFLILLGLSGLPEIDLAPFFSPKVALAESREFAPASGIEDLVVLREVPGLSGSSLEVLTVPLDGRTIAEAISEENLVPGTRAVSLNRRFYEALVPSDRWFGEQEHLATPYAA
jgi:hypothetical protein